MSTQGSDDGLPVNIVQGTHGQLIAFLVLNVWTAHLGVPFLLGIVLFSKRVKRHPTFVNLCVAFIIIGISSSLLLYAGRITGREPSRMLCLLQASLLYGMPAISSTAAFMLVLQMFFTIRAAHFGKKYLDEDHRIRMWLMLIAPYFTFFASILTTAVVGSINPRNVSRNRRFFYCSVSSLPLTNTITTFSAFMLLGTLIFIGWTMVVIYKRWKIDSSDTHSALPRVTLDLSLPLRIIGFGIYIIISMSLSLLSIQSPESPVPDLVIACAATVFVVIFGTQRDILSVICVWKKPEPPQISEAYDIDLRGAFDQESIGDTKGNKPDSLFTRPFTPRRPFQQSFK